MGPDLERTFDLQCHMMDEDTRGTNYTFDKKKNVILNPKQQKHVLIKAIQAFMHGGPVKGDKGDKIIQAFTGSSALPQLTKDVFNSTMAVDEFDTFWQESFRGIQLRKGQLEWEIANVASGLSFELIPEGGKVKFFGVSGSKTSAKIAKYGAATGVTWEMIEGRKLYQFVEMLLKVRSELNNLWADIHYGLLATAAASEAISWQGTTTDPIVERDIATINETYLTIGEATKDKGYGDTANAKMIIYASPNLKARLNQALRMTSQLSLGARTAGASSSAAGQIIEFNVQVRYTWSSLITANKALMILPGQKIQNSAYLRELGLMEREIDTLNELRTYWTAFGAIVADTEQTAIMSFT